MGRNLLLMGALLAGIVAVAGFAVKGRITDGGSKQQVSKEQSLSISVNSVAIDARQPQHIKTATFALG
jgi:hypothetical protein